MKPETVNEILARHGYVHGPAGAHGVHAVFDRNGGLAGYFRAHEVLPALGLNKPREVAA